MHLHDQPDVLVVGAVPVGMLTALLLGEGGVRVQLIDQEPRTATRSYACALHPRSLSLLRRAGIADDAIKLGRRLDSLALYQGAARRGEIKFSELPTEYPFALVLDQSALEDLLEEKLRGMAHISVNWNHRLADLDVSGWKPVATVERLVQTGKGYSVPDFDWEVQKRWLVRPDFVVGADGQNSLVRQRLNLSYDPVGGPELFAVHEMESPAEFDHEMRLVCNAPAAGVMWPLSDHKCRWSFRLPAAEAPGDFPAKDRSRIVVVEPPGKNDARHEFERLIETHAPWFRKDIDKLDWCAHIQFEHRLASEFGRGHCWLAGDAAHQTGPVGMQSLNAGLLEAADLATRLKAVLTGKAPLETLETYGRIHLGAWRELLGLSSGAKPASGLETQTRERVALLRECLPGTGNELSLMLERLGSSFS